MSHRKHSPLENFDEIRSFVRTDGLLLRKYQSPVGPEVERSVGVERLGSLVIALKEN
jgi:hypothetical protein